MALKATHNNIEFGVGDTIRVSQRIAEGEKSRLQVFEGMVIGVKGKGIGKTFTVRRIGAQKVGIEQIFPLSGPTIEKIDVVRRGLEGVERAKLYYTRDKSTREVEKIYSRAKRRQTEKSSK